MRKTKKALASLAIAGMVLSIAPMSVFGATDVTRLSDADRVGTAIAIAANGWTSADNVIVVPADDANIVDALAAAPLAGQLNAPILVTYKGALDPKVQQKIVDLKAKNVYAVGALSADTVASLKAISGVNVTALQGADRTETAAKVAAQLTNIKGSFVVAYNGVADAMSAASYAAANGYSILVENPDATLPASEAAYKGATQYTVGGQAKLDGATTLAGADRYATNDAVVNALDYKYDKVYVANGETLVDALAGASLAAKTNSPIVLADTTKAATGVNDNVTPSTQVIALGGVGAVPEAVRASVGKTTPSGPVSVQSVSANTANSIKVVFANAVADTSKVTFKVTRGASDAVVTTTWNDAKTEATLAASSNFAEGVYSVAVKNGDADLGTSSVDITAQRVAKISFDSTTLAVITGGKTGYVSYHAFDQYGNDITSKYLAGSSYINWSCGIGNITSDDKGILTIHPFGWSESGDASTTVLTQYQTTVITAVTKSQTVPCTATASVNISTQVGTISDIALNKLVTSDGAEATPQMGDSEKYYIDYTAKDMSGNETKSKTLVDAGLITSTIDSEDLRLVTSNSELVKAKLVDDPSDDTKAAIEVTILDPVNYTMVQDQPITITATSYTGKTSSLTFTLKREQKVNTLSLMAPTETISSGQTGVEIPFVAYDQDGKQLTKYTDIAKNNVVSLSPQKNDGDTTGLYFEENADGTASLKYDAPANNGTTALQETLNATVNNTSSFSSITINVDLPKKGDTLKLNDSILLSRMAEGATQSLDFGFNDGGFTVEDQYGRTIDMTSKNVIDGITYYVKASLPASAAGTLSFSGGQDYAYAGHEVVLKAGAAAGSATVSFKLMKSTDATIGNADDVALDTKTLSMTVLADKDISDYTLTEAPNPIYAASDPTPTKQQKDQFVKVITYGKTSSGSKVVLDPSKVSLGASSSSDFYTYMGDDNTQTKVAATKLDPSKSGSSTTISATVYNDNDKRYHSATTTVTSKTDAPVAQSAGFYAQTVDRADSMTATGITYDGTTVTVNLNGTQGQYAGQSLNAAALGIPATNVLNAIAGRDLTRYTNNTAVLAANQHAVLTAGDDNRGYIYLYGLDQYGSKDMNLGQVKIADCSNDGASTPTNVAQVVDNTLVFNYVPTTSDYIIVSGVTTNGLMETIKIKFEGSDPVAAAAKVALSASITAATNAETGKVEGAVAGNQIVGSKLILDAAIAAAQGVYDDTTSTAAQLTAAKGTLDTAVTVYNASVVADISTGLVDPGLAMSGTTTGSITGYTPVAGETLNVTSDTPATLSVDAATGLAVTAHLQGSANVTVQVKDATGHVIKTGTIAITVGA